MYTIKDFNITILILIIIIIVSYKSLLIAGKNDSECNFTVYNKSQTIIKPK
jgi:hypothetical protein